MRPILDESHIHPAIRATVEKAPAALTEVQAAIQQHAVVVVGMRQNPFPRKARKLLENAGITFHYLEYGGYFSQWRERNTLKMWCGWPTLPMIFVRGSLVGGADDLAKLIDSGEIKTLLA